MDFHLPNLTSDTAENLRNQLRKNTLLIKFSQLTVGAILPIAEGVLINLATGASTKELASPFWGALAVVGAVHFIFLIIILSSESPLTQFLLEFDSQEEDLREAKAKTETLEMFLATFRESTVAAQASLLTIEKMARDKKENLSEVFEEVLGPWLAQRKNIFWFYDTATRDNFAVYLIRDSGKLTKEFRKCHKDIKQTNRDWEPGRGHVGICYALKTSLFSPDITKADVAELTGSNYPEDIKNYRSVISTPIIVNENIIGVFIVTSSSPDQFEKEIHQPVIELMSTLLAQSSRRCWIEQKE